MLATKAMTTTIKNKLCKEEEEEEEEEEEHRKLQHGRKNQQWQPRESNSIVKLQWIHSIYVDI